MNKIFKNEKLMYTAIIEYWDTRPCLYLKQKLCVVYDTRNWNSDNTFYRDPNYQQGCISSALFPHDTNR